MYSLVLMTAMTGAPDGPEFNGYFRDLFSGRGCAGCYGNSAPPRYSCFGGGCAGSAYTQGCSGSAAYPTGCAGSYYNGCNGCNGCNGDTFISRVRRLFDRGNCSGCSGCSGSGYGCVGSGYGCTGSGYGCTGSGYGCGASAYSCFGGPAMSYTPVFSGGLSCQGGALPIAPAPMFDPYPPSPGSTPPPTIPYAPPEPAPGLNSQNTGVKPAAHSDSALVSSGNSSNRATVLVKLPADARLFADSRQLSLTGAERKFVSPPLPAGQEFTYRFRVEYERDGEVVSVTKKVPVRAGTTSSITFGDLTAPAEQTPPSSSGGPVAAAPTSNSAKSEAPTTPVTPTASSPQPDPAVNAPATPATDRATITVKLPVGATLYVNDRRSPSIDPVRQFSTPPLPVGREFAYLMKTEILRNGQVETFTQKVPFRAGERVEVDFTSIGRQ
jgi:uncharacterized protein (TIGR03000 family)